jgi:broad specificity phosphatase PhoE
LLIRHGQQDVNLQGTVGELIDPPLSQQGQAQARLLGEALSTTRFDAIFASPLLRALDTARAVAAHHRLEPEIVPDVREVELFRDIPPEKTPSEVIGRDLLEAVRQRMLNERSWDVYPNSEGSHAFRKRVINAIESLIARNVGERIAVVCHGGVINAYTGHIVGTPYDMFFRPAHTSISIVAAGRNRRVLRSLNDVHHLLTAEGELSTY